MSKRYEICSLIAASADSTITVTVSDPDADGCPIAYVNSQLEDLVHDPYRFVVGKSLSDLMSDEPGADGNTISATRQGEPSSGCLIAALPSGEDLRLHTFIDANQVEKRRNFTLGYHYEVRSSKFARRDDTIDGDHKWHGVRRSLHATMTMQKEALRMRSDGMFKMAKLMLTRRRSGL